MWRLKSAAILLIVTCVLTGYGTGEGKAAPCAEDLSSCSSDGCAAPGSPDALINQLKRTQPTSNTPVSITLDDFESLQVQADNAVGQKVTLSKAGRNKLQGLDVSSGKVGEGDLVRVMGFIVGLPNRPSANSIESVNCRLTGQENHDFHIPIARRAEDTEFNAIVVEMIPQDRNKGWTLAKIKRMAREGRPVLVDGQLLYDNKHRVNNNPREPIGGQPARFSLWEVHPVTEFRVCLKPEKACDVQDLAQWELLETVR